MVCRTNKPEKSLPAATTIVARAGKENVNVDDVAGDVDNGDNDSDDNAGFFTPPQLHGVMTSDDYRRDHNNSRGRMYSDASSTMGGLTLGGYSTSDGYTTEASNWNAVDGFRGFSTRSLATTDDDSTMDASFFDNEDDDDLGYEQQQLIDIDAPPGKLGLLIDTPERTGSPFVYGIKDWSPLAHILQVGDTIMALDGEDVRLCTAIEISKRLSRKSANKCRRLSIVRKVYESG